MGEFDPGTTEVLVVLGLMVLVVLIAVAVALHRQRKVSPAPLAQEPAATPAPRTRVASAKGARMDLFTPLGHGADPFAGQHGPANVASSPLFTPLGQPAGSATAAAAVAPEAPAAAAAPDGPAPAFAPVGECPIQGQRCFITGELLAICTCPDCKQWRKTHGAKS